MSANLDYRDVRLLRDIAAMPYVPEHEIDVAAESGGHRAPAGDVTPQQRAVLNCLSHGMTRTQAGEALGLSPDTVKSHLRRARYRLRAKTAEHAIAIAIRQGLIP